jgi:hypothetical protein
MKLTTTNEHYARVERERIAGESFLHALERLALDDAAAATKTAIEAALMLGYSDASGFKMARDRMRAFVVDARIGQLARHKKGPKYGALRAVENAG